MRCLFSEFDAERFSFREDPVLVLESFWTGPERERFRRAMSAGEWTALEALPAVRETFRDCGNWLKSDIAAAERTLLLERTMLPCVTRHIDAVHGLKGRVMGFHYYTYGPGDCLTLHDDMNSGDPDDPRRRSVRRRLALVTYLHERWDPNWGGELITYAPGRNGDPEVEHCIMPTPGCLVIFAVPKLHRLCRVDPLAGPNRRLSIAGWFMTEH